MHKTKRKLSKKNKKNDKKQKIKMKQNKLIKNEINEVTVMSRCFSTAVGLPSANRSQFVQCSVHFAEK